MTQEEAEQKALRMLNRAMRWETRWYPRRHMRFALLVVLPIFLAFLGLVVLIDRVFSSFAGR